MAKIQKIFAREILNSKGMPTVEANVILDNGSFGIGSSPSGTSTGKHEAREIRDGDPGRYNGNGVLNAISNVDKVIAPKLIGMNADDTRQIDLAMIELDGTDNKQNLGTNAILPVSIATAKAVANSEKLPLFLFLKRFIPRNIPFKIPTPCFNILNGGKHAGNNLDFQEFLIIPATNINYKDSLNMAVNAYYSLKNTLTEKNASTLIGDEGGFGPSFPTNRDALNMVQEAILSSKLRINYDIFLGLDIAGNNFYDNGTYRIRDKGEGHINSDDLLSFYDQLSQDFHLLYMEDPLSEDDSEGWSKIGELKSSSHAMIVGDDLTVTNPARLQAALSKKAITGIVIKPNQIGTITEALAVIEMAREAGLKIIVSHRSVETNDDFIADFAVAVSSDYVKFGAPARGERVAKYNRLLWIDQKIRS